MRVLSADGHDVVGLDILESPHTAIVGSITERDVVRRSLRDVEAVVHAATLHKPHVDSHGRQEFVDANITGTLNLLEEAVAAGWRALSHEHHERVRASAGAAGGAPAAWITEEVAPVPRNVYGVTKTAAEDLCELVHRDHGYPA